MEGGFEGLNLQFRTTFLNVEHFYDDQFRVQYLGGKKKETKKKLKFECQEIMGLFKIEDLAEEPRKYKNAGISLFKK